MHVAMIEKTLQGFQVLQLLLVIHRSQEVPNTQKYLIVIFVSAHDKVFVTCIPICPGTPGGPSVPCNTLHHSDMIGLE